MADQLHEVLGRPAVVIQRLGAGQRLALQDTRRAAPDGRNLMLMTHGPFSLYPHIYTKLDYDPDADFTPILGVGKFGMGIATGPGTPAKTFDELMDWIRANRNEAVFGAAPGSGALPHFVGAAIGLEKKMRLEQIPYKEGTVAVTDLVSGRLPILVTGLSALVPMHQEGRLRLLAVTGDARISTLPQVPTLRECGIQFNTTNYLALFGPARMPPALVSELANAVAPMRTNPVIVDKLEQQLMSTWLASGREVTQMFQDERRRLGEIVRAVGYQPQPA
jgi:tripartite-type tricarboxylate transporter receptor subunit TctC